MNGDTHPVNARVNGAVHDRSMNEAVNDRRALEPKVFEAEFVTDDTPNTPTDDHSPGKGTALAWGRLWTHTRTLATRVWRSDRVVRARSVLAYRARKAPADLVRLVWFLLRGHWRWLVKAWSWATYADLRADVRAARLAGDVQARRAAQELIRADATARWARVGIVLRRAVMTVRAAGPVAVLLWLVDAIMDRADMWPWLAGTYTAIDATWTVLTTAVPVAATCLPVAWVIAAVFEGRDHTPGAGWLIRPDRDDAGSWVDERMISRALAHLGIAPLNAFFKDGGELVYTVPARKDGDGTFAQVRLPLGVTADMVAGQRGKIAANLGRSGLETWPTKGDEDGVLDLWVADKGSLSGGAGSWPLLDDTGPDGGRVDVFEGVPFGLSQRGMVINAPLIGASWLVGGRPGQGKTSALRTLLLGAALDPTAELWVFVLGESPDFEPFTPRLSRYRMGMEDQVAEAACTALADLADEMEERGKTLGAQPGQPPKVSRRLADQRRLGLHPLVIAIDECHELFQHPRFGKRAAELAVRLVKRGRKYGIVPLFATQSPTKDSIPKEITRNITCGVAFSVADWIANDGLLGSGRYAAGIRATELRAHKDRGTCVAVGVTDATFELIRSYYVPFEDGADDVTPIIARALRLIADDDRALPASQRLELGTAPSAPDHLTAVAEAMRGERRVRTQVVLTRMAALNPTVYDGWTLTDLRDVLTDFGITVRKSDGVKVLRVEDVTTALRNRTEDDIGGHQHRDEHDRETVRDPAGSQGLLPAPFLAQTPCPDQDKHPLGRAGNPLRHSPKTPGKPGPDRERDGSLPDTSGGGGHDD
jgi:DNA segregation ATPase FtsK/SpoIIIE, S-DNA-T family